MHDEARMMISKWYEDFKPILCTGKIADVGALNINGSSRDVLPQNTVDGFDVYKGPDVDHVIEEGKVSDEFKGKYVGVVMANSLQCATDKKEMLFEAYELLMTGGIIFITVCSEQCTITHSSSPISGDHWRFTKESLELETARFFRGTAFSLSDPHHIYFIGVKI